MTLVKLVLGIPMLLNCNQPANQKAAFWGYGYYKTVTAGMNGT